MADAVKTHRILLVDDEEHLLVTLSDFLTHEGYGVEVARSGEEALTALQRATYDMIILDISMPGMGGLGFLKKVSEDGAQAPCPILVLTARANLRDFFGNVDVAGFLSKPCRKDELLANLTRILGTEPKPKPPPVPRVKRRVLLAEDDGARAAEISRHFEKIGYVVEIAATGPRVVESAPNSKPDVIILKEILTDMNGDAVAALLRAMPSTRGIPVVLYAESGMGMPEYRVGQANVKRRVKVSDWSALAAMAEEVLEQDA